MAMIAKGRTSTHRDDAWNFAPGAELVPGRHVLKLLGGGRRYEAYLAHDETLLSPVVVKVLRPSRAADTSAREGLADEHEILATLNHPSICRVFDAVLDGDRPHVVLEHIEGPRLSTLIRKFGRVDLDQLIELGVQLSSAVHYLHGRGIAHLDIKPQNTIMGAPPRLIDFSVARSAEQAARLRSPVGTDAYMAPEQCAPEERGPVRLASDIWGLGVTLYEAATGRLPYPRPTDDDNYPQLHHPVDDLGPDVPAAVATLILACLAADAAERPTARDVARTLEPLVAALPRKIVLGRLRPSW